MSTKSVTCAGADAAHLLFQLVSRRYEPGAMLIATNHSVDWGVLRDAKGAVCGWRFTTTDQEHPDRWTRRAMREMRVCLRLRRAIQ